MVYKPRTVDEIYTSLRNGLTGRIAKLTNFVETSFNYIWTQAFSNRFRDNELALLAAQLSGWIDYAGGPITEEDLDVLDIQNVEPEDVNEYMDDVDLDNLVEIVGTERDPGEEAQGVVTFTTVSAETDILEGELVATQPDSNGDTLQYETTEEVTSQSGETEVDANVVAVEVGDEYNVGSGQVTYLPSPPTGVQGVTNDLSITGGANEETNDELRERAKNAIFDKSGGGTARGVEGFVLSNTEDVSSVTVAEYPGGNDSLAVDSPSPGGPGGASSTSPFADVIVEGGIQSDIEDSIEESRPVAIQHNFVRPTLVEVNVTANVEGTNIDTEEVEAAISTYINSLDLGEPVFRDKIIQRAMNADSQVENIDDLNIAVSNELITYSTGTDIYTLNKGVEMEDDGITSVSGTLSGSTVTFVEDTDYQEVDDDSDGSDDAIDWSLGGDNPDNSTDFFVTYDIIEDIPIDQYEKGDANSITVNVV